MSNIFYVFKTYSNDDEENSNLLFVTNEDKIFTLGKNKNGVLGLGHQNEVNEVEIIPQLCDESVNNFYNSEDFVLCLTSDNRLYSWGKNDHGQLGIGKLSFSEIFKPKLIEYFNDKTIVQVCCGYQFSSVLTSDGRVHLWGTHSIEEKFFVTLIASELNEEIKSIHCSRNQTFCVTISGNVYYCKNTNNDKFECICIDTLSNIQAICSSYEYTYFISRDSIIYYSEKEINFDTKPKKLFINLDFKPTFRTISVYGFNSLIHNCVYELIEGICNLTKYRNPFEYYCDRHKVTHKTIELNTKEKIPSIDTKSAISFNNPSNILDIFAITKEAISPTMNIEYFHVLDKNNILFVTVEDDVYGYGTNEFGCCGLGYNNALTKPELINELCDRRVILFYSGGEFTFALTPDHIIYAWGKMNNSQDSFSPPKKVIKSLWEINNISCSRDHALILTDNGIVYGWGNNADGQIDEDQIGYFDKPLELKKLPRIKLIACSTKRSFAVCEKNDLYIWKDEQSKLYYTIIKYPDYISNICAIDSILNNLYLLICGQIFNLEFMSKLYKKIECPDRIISINSIRFNRIIAANENDTIHWITSDNRIIKTTYKTHFNYCAEKYQITYKTINLKLQNEIHKKSIPIQGIYIHNLYLFLKLFFLITFINRNFMSIRI